MVGVIIMFGSVLFGSKVYLVIGGNWYVLKVVGSVCMVVCE